MNQFFFSGEKKWLKIFGKVKCVERLIDKFVQIGFIVSKVKVQTETKKAPLSRYIQSAFISIKGFRYKRVNQQHFNETKVRPKGWLQALVPEDYFQNQVFSLFMVANIFSMLAKMSFDFFAIVKYFLWNFDFCPNLWSKIRN